MGGEKILIVDDEKSLAEILGVHLKAEGYSVSTAESVDKALKILEQGPVDLVLLDIMMPDKDGFDFLWAVSSSHGKPRMPVIVMTTREEFESLMEGLAVDGFLSKPFEMHLALQEVRRLLSRRRKTIYLADCQGSRQAQAIAKDLKEERFDVFFIKDMSDFRECWAKQPADYIVMEYEQNSVDGEDMIREIRQCAAVPLIVYSCSGMDFGEKSLRAGASRYIGKPQTPSAIVTAVREFEMKK